MAVIRKTTIILSLIAAAGVSAGIVIAISASGAKEDEERNVRINAFTLGIINPSSSSIVEADLQESTVLRYSNISALFDKRDNAPVSPIYITETHTILKDTDELRWIYLMYLWDRDLLNVTDSNGRNILESWTPITLRDVAYGWTFECDDGRTVSTLTYPPFKISFNRTIKSGEDIFIKYGHVALAFQYNAADKTIDGGNNNKLYNLTLASFYKLQKEDVKFPSNVEIVSQREQTCDIKGRGEEFLNQGYVYDVIFRLKNEK